MEQRNEKTLFYVHLPAKYYEKVQFKIKNVVQFVLFLSLGIGMFWYVYHNQNPEQLWGAFKNVDFFWLGMTVVVMLISHLSRSVRWMMLVEPLGKKVSFWNATLATFLGYFANMALPRLGEVTRCAVLGKYEKIPTSKLLGTVVVERAIDMIMFLICLLLAVLLQFEVFLHLRKRYLEQSEPTSETSHVWLYVCVALFVLGFLIYRRFSTHIQETQLYIKVQNLIQNVLEGFKTVWKLRNFNVFLFHTILIWLCYYLMMYFGFKVFHFSSELSSIVALSIFVLGSLGMILPAPGGIGSFHFFVISGLLFYLPNEPDVKEKAAAFALLIHGVQTIFIMISGVISLLLLPILNRKR